MRAWVAADLSGLRWLPRATPHPDFDLLAGEDAVGRLTWQAGRSSLATGETATGRWSMKRVGFLNPRVPVRAPDSDKEVAQLVLHFRSSTFTTSDGATYRLVHKGRLVPAWAFLDGHGETVLNVEAVREDSTLAGGLVTVNAGAVANPHLALLLMIAWYFVVMEWTEEETEAKTSSTLVAWSQ